MRQSYSFFPGFLITAFLSIVFTACSHDEAFEDSPAKFIAVSEKAAIPASIAVPANAPKGNTRVATYYATGVQQYKAKEKTGSDPVVYEWVFVSPKAGLYDAANRKVGTHGAGPFWQLSASDSILAQPFVPARTAPGPNGSSIDWLLLMPKTGTIPTGIFSGVNYIQRITTRGGKAPAKPPTNANQVIEVSYTAVYRFSKKNA